MVCLLSGIIVLGYYKLSLVNTRILENRFTLWRLTIRP